MPLLYYWRFDNYQRDLNYGVAYHLNQSNPLLHSIAIGDSLWAFIRNRQRQFVLAAELVVCAKTINPANFHYGPYRVWGDLRRSRYFQVDGQSSSEQVIRSLSPKSDAALLAQSFQGRAAVRTLTLMDHLVLTVAAQSLPLEPRARILPEERLENSLLYGDERAVADLIRETAPGIDQTRQEYLYGPAITRNRDLVQELQKMYDGKCQICRWDPRDIYGHNLCHGHHIQWLSRGGADTLDNMMLICPNHHAAVHKCDVPLDYRGLVYNFGPIEEALQLNMHLVPA